MLTITSPSGDTTQGSVVAFDRGNPSTILFRTEADRYLVGDLAEDGVFDAYPSEMGSSFRFREGRDDDRAIAAAGNRFGIMLDPA